ncbi:MULTISPECIES: hypothetical protein [unclassified Streptomyces]|uniref:hypothetical protein n=1 Tax=unclassified Streptomyces TaxID=2593676 RepID=UPI000CDA5A4F|nr:hypothetical protein [Streptomyces sp. SM10]
MDQQDEIWRRFLEDSEHAIRRTAPREPSARERIEAADQFRAAYDPSASQARSEIEAVGDLWQPTAAPVRPPWRTLDGRGRLWRATRIVGTVSALIAVLATMSRLSTGPTLRTEPHIGVTLEQSEEASDGLRPTAPSP